MNTRQALVVGMSYYEQLEELVAGERDAHQIERVLESHFDGTPNFEVTVRNSTPGDPLTIGTFLSEFGAFIQGSRPDDELVFYFSGHGDASNWGLQLLMAEQPGGQGMGVPFEMLMYRASQGSFRSLTCILDCCFSGAAAMQAFPGSLDLSLLRRNVTILASSSGPSYLEEDMSDYTREIVAGLDGDARDPGGHVTPFELHRWTSSRMRETRNGPPVLKSNCSEAIDLRSPTGR